MSKGSELIQNTGLLTIGQFATKALSFFLVPLYTYVLTTAEYGSYDLVTTTVNLLIPLLTLNVADVAGRYSIGDEFDKCQVFSITLKWIAIGVMFAALLIAGDILLGNPFLLGTYWHYFIALFALTALNGSLTLFVRGIELIKEIAISGVLGTSVIIALNILFLLVFGFGLDGYFLAYIIGMFAQVLYLLLVSKSWKYITVKIDKQLEKRFLRYSVPMIANTIAWWVNNLADRYIVILFCGISANGIYSVAYKIPSILNAIQGTFSQAWTLTAVKEFNLSDDDGFFARTYSKYQMILVLLCSLLIVVDRPLAALLFSNDFYEAWQYAPALLISVVFGALAGYIGAFFTAMEKASLFAKTSFAGAIVNIAFNFMLIPFCGPLGAAIATLFSCFTIWSLRMKYVKQMMSLEIKLGRDLFSYGIVLAQAIALLVFRQESAILYMGEALGICLILIMYREEAFGVFKSAALFLRQRRD